MLRPIVPCKGCKDRAVGCHGSCERYARFKEQMAVFKDHVRMERDAENLSKPQMKVQKRFFK